ncbi:related to N-methylhydantoinase A/acetone carboxylase, beta subunit [Phialocephala subalpina]|uniref:Related to N-methylhydantoinase A/acetone carboxylase, beta subunit n=1 Tax=Phialocephala subalpina TaxID=576137 RepID=A0A1L7WGA2_9HELO|nr:related to N-methylhydantoinase A/acetone carboxylase, beta subunit [Phialocephala subalpina]
MEPGKLIVGVDVGGTNTDAVLDPAKLGPDAVISSYKAITGTDMTTGIAEAIRTLPQQANLPPTSVASLMIGTTHFINAVVERDASRLDSVAVIRLAAGSYLRYTPPFIDFPPALKRIIDGHTAFISGGVEIDGAEIGPIKEAEVYEQAKIIKEKGLRKIAVVGIYSPFDEKYRQEEHVRDLLWKELDKDVDIVCSKDISGIGILARENATILNASILRFAKRTIAGFKRAMKRLNLSCPLYLTSNSGQFLSSKEAMSYPIQIFSSGATNSIRGASFLSSESQLKESRYVIDIGGTTTDIGCLLPSRFPRLASSSTELGGVRVNFAMPQVESIGLGGGSPVHELPDGRISIGPDSVGQALREKAKCFGGDSLTATDIMVAAGETKIGNSTPEVLPATISTAKDKIMKMLEDHIDRMKTSPEPCSLPLVGGGAFLCPPRLEGVVSIEIPEHAQVANAVGAAVAEIGEDFEVIVDTSKKKSTLKEVKAKAISQAIARGAKEGSFRTIEETVEGIPYIEGKFKITVKVVGPVDYERFLNDTEIGVIDGLAIDESYHETKQSNIEDHDDASAEAEVDHATYRPHTDSNRFWHLSEADAFYISIGCYIVSCAGGSTPYAAWLETRQLLRDGGKVKIMDIEDLLADALVGPVAGMGNPVIAVERLGGEMILHAIQEMERHLKIKFTALMTAEIGGSNGMAPLLLSSSKAYDIPCVDADLMGKFPRNNSFHTRYLLVADPPNCVGRAFPSFEMSSLFIGSEDINHLLPASLSSGGGTNMTLTSAKDSASVDKVLRAACITMGEMFSLAAGISARPIPKIELQQNGIPKSLSLSWQLGRAVVRARSKGTIATVHEDLIEEFGGPQSAKKVFEGKIKDDSKGGDEDGPEKVAISFVNENLVVEATYKSEETKILATVPDLIMVLDTLTGEAVGVPEYRYGLKVMVMVAAAHPLWTSPRGLKITGPTAFGYDIDFKPCGTYGVVTSVIDEFGPAKKANA